jgi:hypothetical protein
MSIAGNHTDVNAQVDREYAEAWRPDPGDKLIGEVIELSQRDGAYGVYPIITLKQSDGVELAFHAFHTVAQSRLASARPHVGERVAVKYLGLNNSGDRPYHDYRVAVDGPAAAFNWGAFSDSDAAGEVEPDIPTSYDDESATDDDIPF